MKYLLVQPYADGPQRFERATVVSTHQTVDGAFAALARHASRLEEFGIRSDAIELFVVDEERRPVPGLAPRIALRLAESPITDPGRLAGEGTIDQVLDDLAQLRLLGADTVVLDPFNGDPDETHRPEVAWQALATVSAGARHLGE